MQGITYEVSLGAYVNSVRAFHQGAQVAYLSWSASVRADGEIIELGVDKNYVRNKIATTMLAKAREVDPRVHHSAARTRLGQAWALAVRLPGEILPRWQPIADFEVNFQLEKV